MRHMSDLPLFKKAFLQHASAGATCSPPTAQLNACDAGLRRLLKHQLYQGTTTRRSRLISS
jgi:hypothetical protein